MIAIAVRPANLCCDWQQHSNIYEDGETTNAISTKTLQITEYVYANRQKKHILH